MNGRTAKLLRRSARVSRLRKRDVIRMWNETPWRERAAKRREIQALLGEHGREVRS